jgi:hypothetical protein
VALEGAGPGEAFGGGEGVVGELGGAADILQFGGALDDAKVGDEFGGVVERGEAGERIGEALAVAGGEALGFPLDAEFFPGAAELLKQVPQVARGRGVGAVDPDAHIVDDRSEARLEEVRRAR